MAFTVAAYGYALWNRRGLRPHLRVLASQPGPGSPIETLPQQLLRSGPIPIPIFEGDRVEMEIGLDTSGGPRGPARMHGLIGAAELSVATGLVPRAGWRDRRLLSAMRRGPVNARAWVLEAGDPLGFFRSRSRTPDAEVALVLPRFASVAERPEAREIEASVAAPRSGSGSELFGVREYRPGDPLRRIHWRSSARHGALVVREYEPPGVQTLGIFCDPAPATQAVSDQIARIAASEAWDCIREGGRVVLWAPGLEPSLPSEARALWALLEWLARFPTPSRLTGQMWADGSDLTPPVVSDAVAVTGDAAPVLIEALETVRHRGGRIRAWAVGDMDLDIEAPIRRVGTSWPL